MMLFSNCVRYANAVLFLDQASIHSFCSYDKNSVGNCYILCTLQFKHINNTSSIYASPKRPTLKEVRY